MNTVDAIKNESKKILADLQTLGDEIRLKAHLASAESRDTWNQLEPQLHQFQRRVEKATESAMSELRMAGKDLKTNLERLCRELRED